MQSMFFYWMPLNKIVDHAILPSKKKKKRYTNIYRPDGGQNATVLASIKCMGANRYVYLRSFPGICVKLTLCGFTLPAIAPLLVSKPQDIAYKKECRKQGIAAHRNQFNNGFHFLAATLFVWAFFFFFSKRPNLV